MSCLSEVLSQTRDSLRPWVREGEGQGKAGGRPPEYCAGYCRPAPPLAKVQLFSPKLGADTYYRAPPHSPRLALLSTIPQPNAAESNNRAISAAFEIDIVFI